METHGRLGLCLLLAALGMCLAAPVHAKPDPALKCKNKIIESSGNFIRKTTNILQKCRNAVLTGALPPDTDCVTKPEIAAALAGHVRTLERTIARNCGGDDNTCNTSDDISLGAIGWNIGRCPGLPGGDCIDPINGCADVANCLACIGRGAADRMIAVSYDQLVDTSEKVVRKCQVAIGKAAAKFLGLKSKALQSCWSAVNKAKAQAPCPSPGNGKAAEAIAAAAAKLQATICKACGGTDKACGGGDDLTPAAIGFPGICPGTAAPARFTPCSEVVTVLPILADCVECITEFGVDCTDRAAVPYLTAYPLTCQPNLTLDFSKPPVFGSTALAAGFVPDPFTVGVTSGGPVNVSYLGGGCAGFATSAPSFSVNYTSGAFPLLRFYFTGSGDTTMIINAPNGNFFCVDDSFGTINPTIDFNSPSSGRYDVWIGSYASSNVSIAGTLFVTRNSGNHP